MHTDQRAWTPNELVILERLLGKVSAATIAKKLKRTEPSVVMKIKALGNSRRVCEGYTMRDLEACLGEDHHKIQRWIANGWLRDRLQGTNRHNGNGHDIHRFHEKDMLHFMKTHSRESIWARLSLPGFGTLFSCAEPKLPVLRRLRVQEDENCKN